MSEKLAQEWESVPGASYQAEESKIEENPHHLYYDGRRGSYYRKSDEGDFIIQKEGAVRRFLKSLGYSDKKPDDGELSPVGEAMEEIERKFSVHHVGEVAGYLAGLHLMGNHRVLVTRSPRFITPKKGEWNHLKKFMKTLLPDDQAEWYFGWLSETIKVLYAGRYRGGQAVVIAGAAGCGKTLLVSLITEILGGRSGSPLAYLSGETDFNSELAEAEHLVIDDDASDSSPKTRRRLGAKLKGFVAARVHRVHPKGRAAIQLRPFWRLTLLLNSDPTALSVLPQMESALEDKISLLMASQGVFPVAKDDPFFEDRLWGCLAGELPEFVHYLLNEHVVRKEWKSARWGVKSYHHAQVLEMMEPPLENELLALIDAHWAALIYTLNPEANGELKLYEGTARDIETVLRAEVGRDVANRLFYGLNVCGILLGNLRDKMPMRVSSRILSGYTHWKIQPKQG